MYFIYRKMKVKKNYLIPKYMNNNVSKFIVLHKNESGSFMLLIGVLYYLISFKQGNNVIK